MFSQKADAANLYGAYYNREIRVNGEITYANRVEPSYVSISKTSMYFSLVNDSYPTWFIRVGRTNEILIERVHFRYRICN